MKKRFQHIIRQTSGILLVVMVLALSALAQNPVQGIVVEKCDTIEFRVEDLPGLPSDRYTWDLYRDSTVNFATTKGDIDAVPYFVDGMYGSGRGSSVKVTGLDPGRYFLRIMVWNEEICTNNLELYKFDVIERLPYAVLYGDSACYGEPTVLKVVFTGRGPWEVLVTNSDGTINFNLMGDVETEKTYSLPPLPVGPTEFHIVKVTDKCTVNDQIVEKTTVHIYPRPSTSRIYVADTMGP